jgi:hypothetical protein
MNLLGKAAMEARDEGRFDEALRILEDQFKQMDSGALSVSANHFMTMFEWSMLVEEYPPARQSMARARDEQVERLKHGDERFGGKSSDNPRSRFNVIAEMNKILQESTSTYEVFVELLSARPDAAKRCAFLALPAMVEMGDFTLAERFLGNPLERLDDLNRLAESYPLFPAPGGVPRLAAELCNFTKDVTLLEAVLRGLGRNDEALSLRRAALDGLVNEEMRALSTRELENPGTIVRELTAHHSPG